MGVKSVINALHERKKAAGLKVPYGYFENQSISAKPQNISGAIGGPRRRIMAKTPYVPDQYDAEIYRYAHGGSFPRWRNHAVVKWVLRYADLLDADQIYNNKNTRGELDRTADQLVREALDFIDEIHAETREVATELGIKTADIPKAAHPSDILIRRHWPDNTYDKARKALTSTHFTHRMGRVADTEEKIPS